MHVTQALAALEQGRAIVVSDSTLEPEQVERVRIETGEEVYWIRTSGARWLSIDTVSEEVLLFQDLDEPVDDAEDTILYRGTDYEFSSEGAGKVYDEDGEETDEVQFRDFESEANVLRVVHYEVTGDTVASLGHRIIEEELQEV